MSVPNELALRFALKSHPGKVRPLNEDAVGADPNIGLFVLADGLGGYNAGEVASTMAVSSLLSGLGAELERAHSSTDASFDPGRVLRDALVNMNEEIFRAALNSTLYEGMATTAVVAWFLGGRLWVAHAGDSRVYRFRGGELQQITRDHSFSQELLDAGMISADEARVLPAKNLVTRAVGASPSLEPEVHDYDLEAGDIILLCSDGLTEMVSNDLIGVTMSEEEKDIAHAARRLVDGANEAGGRDNCSVILVRVDGVMEPALEAQSTLTLVPAEAPEPALEESSAAASGTDGVPHAGNGLPRTAPEQSPAALSVEAARAAPSATPAGATAAAAVSGAEGTGDAPMREPDHAREMVAVSDEVLARLVGAAPPPVGAQD